MVTPDQFVAQCRSQAGDRYVFGAEASPLDPNPKAFDCSELMQWSADRLGIRPHLPDGAVNQWHACAPITVPLALHTRGALLFAGTGKGGGRNAIHHVACSLGDGTTIEARGRLWGVGTWAAAKRFSFAGLISGIDYSAKPGIQPVNQGGGVQVLPGATSTAIKQFQHGLNIVRKVHGKAPIREDGNYGNETKAAVTEFQKLWNATFTAQRIPVTGGGDPATFKAVAWSVVQLMKAGKV